MLFTGNPEFCSSQWYSNTVTSTHCAVTVHFLHSSTSFTMLLMLLQIVMLSASVLNSYRDKVCNLGIHLSWCYSLQQPHNLFVLLLSPQVPIFFISCIFHVTIRHSKICIYLTYWVSSSLLKINKTLMSFSLNFWCVYIPSFCFSCLFLCIIQKYILMLISQSW